MNVQVITAKSAPSVKAEANNSFLRHKKGERVSYLTPTPTFIAPRFSKGINAGMRVVHDGMTYDIEGVLPGGNRQHVDLVCKLVT